MEHGPLPPHERQWRHPSEVAAEERAQARAEPLPLASRAVALATGSIGLVALAVVFLVVTPARQAAPVAVSATTAPNVGATAEGSATIVAAKRSESDAPPATSPAVPAALATPIGSGQFAVVLRASLAAGGEVPELRLPSGRVTSGDLIGDSDTFGDAVLVQLDDHEPGHEVADHRPHERDVVTVMADPPITVALADLDVVEVVDGTAVVDARGHLVGLCSERAEGGTRLVEVSADLTTTARP